MANNQDNRAAMAFWGARLATGASRVAAFFAARASRVAIIAIIVAAALYVAYLNVWKTVISTAPLPPGVTARTPELNTDLLSIIHSQRSARIEVPRQQYSVDTVLPPLAPP